MNPLKAGKIDRLLLILLSVILSSCNQYEVRTSKGQTIEDKKNVSEAKVRPVDEKRKLPDDAEKPPVERTVTSDEKVKRLEESIRALKDKMSATESSMGALKNRTDQIYDSISGPSSPAKIDTTVRDFSIAKNMYGSFLIACDGITPYLTGYEVKLTIGNLTSARFDGFKIRVKWGDRIVDVKKNDPILPGAWAYVPVVLVPAKADAVRKILVYLEMEDVVLKKPK